MSTVTIDLHDAKSSPVNCNGETIFPLTEDTDSTAASSEQSCYNDVRIIKDIDITVDERHTQASDIVDVSERKNKSILDGVDTAILAAVQCMTDCNSLATTMASSEYYVNETATQFMSDNNAKSVVLVGSNERTIVATPDDRFSDDYEPASKLMRTNVNKLLEETKNGKNKSEEKENTHIVREGSGRGRRKQSKPVRISAQENDADELDLSVPIPTDLSTQVDLFAQNNLSANEGVGSHDAFHEASLSSVNKLDGYQMDSDALTIMCHLCGKVESSQAALAVHTQLIHSNTGVGSICGIPTDSGPVEYPTEYHRLGSELQQEVEESNLESRYVTKKAANTEHNSPGLSSASGGTVHGGVKESKIESPSTAFGDHNGQENDGERIGLDTEMFLLAKQQQYNRELSISNLSKTSMNNETGASVQSIDWTAIFNASASPLDLPMHSKDAHGVYQATKVALMAPQNQRSTTCTPVRTSPGLQSSSSTLLSGTGSSAGSMYLPFMKSDAVGSAFRSSGTSGGSGDTDDYCDRCQKHFCNKYYLRKHKQDVHGVGPGGTTIPSSSGSYQTPPPNNSFMLSGLHGGAALSNNSNSRNTSSMTNQSSSFSLLNTSLPVVLPYHNSLGSANSIGGLLPSSISSQSSISHAELLAASGLLPGISSMASLMPGLKNMANLLPGLTSMSNLMPSLTSMSNLMPGLTSMANMVPGLTSISSLMFLNPFASPLTILKAGSPFLQGPPNFASASLNTLAELQNATNCSAGVGSSLPGIESQEPGSVDTSQRNIMFQFDSSSMGSSADQAVRCDICQKEFCNSYFVKVHKRDKHGILLQSEGGNTSLSSSKSSQLSLSSVPGSTTGIQFHIGHTVGGASSELGESGGNISTEIKQERGVGATSAASSLDIGAISSLDDTCGLCKKQFTNRYSLMMHLINTHNIKPEGFGLASELLQLDKLNVLQAGNKFTTPMRGTILPPTTNASQSAKLSDRVSCDICNKEVCNKYFLKTHKMKVHGLDSHQAEMTGGGGIGIGLGGGGGGDGGGGALGQDNKFFAAVFEAAAMMDAKQRLDQHVSAVKNIDGDLMKSFYAMLAEKDLKLKQNNLQFPDKSLLNLNYNSEREMSAKRQRHRHQNSERMRLRRSIARLGNVGSGGEGAGGSGGSDEMTTTLGLIASHKGDPELGYANREGASGGVAGGQLQSIALNLGLQMAAAGEALQMSNLDRTWRPHSSWHAGESSTLNSAHLSTSPTSMGGEASTKSTPEKPSEEDLIKSGIDPEAYCEICQKEFCSKYFLKTHRQKIHGMVAMQVAPIIDSGRQFRGMSQYALPFQIPFSSNSETISQITAYNAPVAPVSQPNDMSTSALQFEPPILCSAPSMTIRSLSTTELKCDENPSNSSLNDGINYSSTRNREIVAPNMTRVTCQICSKELCNKYFLKTHMMKLHGSNATSVFGGGGTGLAMSELPGNGALELSNSDSSKGGWSNSARSTAGDDGQSGTPAGEKECIASTILTTDADVENLASDLKDSKSNESTKSATGINIIAEESVAESIIGSKTSKSKISKTFLPPSLDIPKMETENETVPDTRTPPVSASAVEQSVSELHQSVGSGPTTFAKDDHGRLSEVTDMNRIKYEGIMAVSSDVDNLKQKCAKTANAETVLQNSESDYNGVPSP